MKKIIALGLLSSILFSSCGGDKKTETTSETKTDSVTESVTTGFQLPQSFYKRFKGTIDDKYEISMGITKISSAEKPDSSLNGSYYYTKIGMPLNLSGQLKSTGNFFLTETNEKGEQTGKFSGEIKDGSIEGIWEGNKKSLPFKLTEVKEGFAGFQFKSYQKENCKNADENKKSGTAENYFDTICSSKKVEWVVLENCGGADKINAVIKDAIVSGSDPKTKFKSVEEFVQSVDQLEKGDFIEAEANVSIGNNENGVIGIIIASYENGGGAHPNHWAAYYNFDLNTGDTIALEDIFTDGFKDKLNPIAEKLFTKVNGTDGWNFDAGQFQVSSNFSLAPGGITFYWNAYEIGPYAAGDPYVFIPFKEINSILKSDGIISKVRQTK